MEEGEQQLDDIYYSWPVDKMMKIDEWSRLNISAKKFVVSDDFDKYYDFIRNKCTISKINDLSLYDEKEIIAKLKCACCERFASGMEYYYCEECNVSYCINCYCRREPNCAQNYDKICCREQQPKCDHVYEEYYYLKHNEICDKCRKNTSEYNVFEITDGCNNPFIEYMQIICSACSSQKPNKPIGILQGDYLLKANGLTPYNIVNGYIYLYDTHIERSYKSKYDTTKLELIKLDTSQYDE